MLIWLKRRFFGSPLNDYAPLPQVVISTKAMTAMAEEMAIIQQQTWDAAEEYARIRQGAAASVEILAQDVREAAQLIKLRSVLM